MGCGATENPVWDLFNLAYSFLWDPQLKRPLEILEIRQPKQPIPKARLLGPLSLQHSDLGPAGVRRAEERAEKESAFVPKAQALGPSMGPNFPTWFCLAFAGQEMAPGGK